MPSKEQMKAMDEAYREAVRERAQADIEKRRIAANIPERYRFAKVADCDETAAIYANRILGGSSANLIITGESGEGKTHTACAILNELYPSMDVLFATMGGVLIDVKDSFIGSDTESQVLGRYTYPRLLVLDDFGKERPTQWSMPLIFEIVNRRYNKMKPTIFTTQYNAQQLGERFGDAEFAQAIIRRMSAQGVSMVAHRV